MKFSTKCSLIAFLFLIILFCCLGSIMQEGFIEGNKNKNKYDMKNRPGNRPGKRPDNRPGKRPDNRPGKRPDQRPGNRPDNRPGNRPDNRPGNRPGNRPNRPNYPPSRPDNSNWDGKKPYLDSSGLSSSKHAFFEDNKDQYILKSQIVPPVCPACPAPIVSSKTEKCQPCPPCARCPEPAFDCKKVPNYKSTDSNYLPRPILNSFAKF